jgi:hypothetical protein
MFTNWLLTLRLKQRKQVLVGNLALCWTIWTSRNEVIFDKSPMHVLYKATSNVRNFNHVRMTWTRWRKHAVYWKQRWWNFLPIMSGDSVIELDRSLFPLELVLYVFFLLSMLRVYDWVFQHSFDVIRAVASSNRPRLGLCFFPLSKKSRGYGPFSTSFL